MEKDFATRVRDRWGNQHCNHTALDKETDRGIDTGNWACISCGLTMLPADWDNLRYGMQKSDGTAER